MFTIFSIPKPFTGLSNTLQRNAIESWLCLGSDCRIILYGNEQGVADAAQEYGVRHVADVAVTEYGTPILSSAFRDASSVANGGRLCYLNSDIIVTPALVEAARRVPMEPFLMVCRRRDVDVAEDLHINLHNLESVLGALDDKASPTGRPTAIDMFLFPSHRMFAEIPGFAVGRQGWDNWLIYTAWQHAIPIIDATPFMSIYHQAHDYAHVPDASGAKWGGPESTRNIDLAGGYDHMFDIHDATHVLDESGLSPARSSEYLERRVERMRRYRPRLFRALMLWKIRYLVAGAFPQL